MSCKVSEISVVEAKQERHHEKRIPIAEYLTTAPDLILHNCFHQFQHMMRLKYNATTQTPRD